MRKLIPFVQFKKHEKKPTEEYYLLQRFNKVHGCFHDFKLQRWYQIVQSVSYKQLDICCVMFLKMLHRSKGHFLHYLKSVPIRSFCGLYFPAFELDTEIYSLNLCIQYECRKIWARKTLNTDDFYAVLFSI